MPLILFASFLVYFVFGTGWYEPSRLIIHGKALTPNPYFKVQWDGGSGFNEYEQRIFSPVFMRQGTQKNIRFVFGSSGRRNGASLSKKVICTAVIADGKLLNLKKIPGTGRYVHHELHFDKNARAVVQVQAKKQISIRFRTNNHSGVAFVSFNGKRVESDLYMANVEAKYKQFDSWLLSEDGFFTVVMDMPRYKVHKLKIVVGQDKPTVNLISVGLQAQGDVAELLGDQLNQSETVQFDNVLGNLKKHFQLFLFLQQILFSLLSSWIVISVISLYKQIGSIRECFYAKKRFIFWIMFFVSLLTFGFWLAAFWPGVMSVDSLKVWRAAMLPDQYLNDHPFLNVILYKYFYHLWGNPAVVPVVQVLLTSLLVSWFFFWLFRQRVPLVMLIICFLFVICSVPIGTYNTVLWKDIPFALLVVFWGCNLVKFYSEKKQGSLQWTRQKKNAFLLLGLALGVVRHNGLVYLAALPILLVFLGMIPVRKTLFVFVVISLACGVSLAFTGGIARRTGFDFVVNEMQRYAGNSSVRNVVKKSEKAINKYLTVLNINQTSQAWDKFHYYFQDRYAYWFLLHSEWWDLYPYIRQDVQFPKLRKLAMKIYEKSNQEPWVWLAWNPVWLLGILPVLLLLFRWLPRTALMGYILLAGTLPLIYLGIFNWRYYYFLYFGLLFIIPLVSLDLTFYRYRQENVIEKGEDDCAFFNNNTKL